MLRGSKSGVRSEFGVKSDVTDWFALEKLSVQRKPREPEQMYHAWGDYASA